MRIITGPNYCKDGDFCVTEIQSGWWHDVPPLGDDIVICEEVSRGWCLLGFPPALH